MACFDLWYEFTIIFLNAGVFTKLLQGHDYSYLLCLQESVFDFCGITVPRCWFTLPHTILFWESQARLVMLQFSKQKSLDQQFSIKMIENCTDRHTWALSQTRFVLRSNTVFTVSAILYFVRKKKENFKMYLSSSGSFEMNVWLIASLKFFTNTLSKTLIIHQMKIYLFSYVSGFIFPDFVKTSLRPECLLDALITKNDFGNLLCLEESFICGAQSNVFYMDYF